MTDSRRLGLGSRTQPKKEVQHREANSERVQLTSLLLSPKDWCCEKGCKIFLILKVFWKPTQSLLAFLTYAGHLKLEWYRVGRFKNNKCLGPTLRNSDVIGLRCGHDNRIFKDSPGDSNVHLCLRPTDLERQTVYTLLFFLRHSIIFPTSMKLYGILMHKKR